MSTAELIVELVLTGLLMLAALLAPALGLDALEPSEASLTMAIAGGFVLGVVVDRCSFCEGIYLDAGELDQLFSKREDERRGILRKLLGV